jgi:predicted ATPase
MKDIVPELEDISIIYLHTRTLGLSFKENGVGRPWSTEEVSDGTIRSLAMLVACFDPRVSGLVLEEPENSLHPWIIKEIVKHLRNLSDSKFVMVTTHSPVVLNSVRPNDVWIVYKRNGETHIRPLIELDPNVEGDWEKGKYRLFDFLESGAILEAVP